MPLTKKRSFSPDEVESFSSGAPAPQKRSFSPGEVDSMDPSGARAGQYDLLRRFNDAGKNFSQPLVPRSAFDLGTGALDALSLKNLEYHPGFQRALKQAEEASPTATMIGKGAGNVALAGATMLAPEVSPLLLNAGMGFATKPEGDNSLSMDLTKRAIAAPIAAGTGKVIELGGRAMGNVGDRLMQKAMGFSQYEPGVGAEMAKRGVMGTRGMMRGQVAEKMPPLADKMRATVAGDARQFPTQPVADEVYNVGRNLTKFKTPSALDIPAIETIERAGQDIDNRGFETLPEMLDRRVAAGERGYNGVTDEAKRHLVGKISQAEQRGYSNILKEQQPAIAPIDKQYSDLATARHYVSQPVSPMEKVIGATRHGALPAVLAMLYGHSPETALLAGGLGAAAMSPMGLSTMGQAATRASQAIPYSSPAFIQGLSPEAANALVKKAMSDQ